MADRDSSHGFLSGLIAGAALGLGAYFFLTKTDEGKKVGQRIKNKSDEIAGELSELAEELEEKGKIFRRQVDTAQVKVKEKIDSVSQSFDKQDIEELQQRGRKMVGRFFVRNGRSVKS